jgi:phosphoribosylanthranilate isomerase
MNLAEVAKLPLREKLQIMEAIWVDLRSHVENIAPPKEHQDLLDSRRERAATGRSKIQDWNQAKHTIGRA